MKGRLVLEDRSTFTGQFFGSNTPAAGEVVFSTGMVGYPESLTDPSYKGQILCLTYPLIGNYGIPDKKNLESERIQVSGLVVSDYIDTPSHASSIKTLGEWLRQENIPGLIIKDTRFLTQKIRQKGTMLGKIEIENRDLRFKNDLRIKNHKSSIINLPAGPLRREASKAGHQSFYDPNQENVLPFVSVKKPQKFGNGRKHIVLIDCGAKLNILRSLLKRKTKITVVPWDFNPLGKIDGFDGVVVSNGPGDPKQAKKTINNVKQLLDKNIPIFGICLGSQILCLAAGGNTFKLKFGHRGQNQPVLDKTKNKAIITSQNHGFAVEMNSLSKDWVEWFVNLNDGTNEGIRHKVKPFLAVQFHPEASPGPVDAGHLFDEFLSLV